MSKHVWTLWLAAGGCWVLYLGWLSGYESGYQEGHTHGVEMSRRITQGNPFAAFKPGYQPPNDLSEPPLTRLAILRD